jgi:polysaccharide biosynthesis/export protein
MPPRRPNFRAASHSRGRGISSSAVVIALAGLLAGCAQLRPSSAFTDQLNAPYVLSSGDKMRVLVYGQESLSNIYTIDGSGQISMPLVGGVPASGLTTAELEQEVKRRLQNGFIREPNVSIEVEQYRPFFVLGEVNQSGQYPYVNGLTAQTAVAIAGGYTPRAERGGVEITRQVAGKLVTGQVPAAYPRRPGDTILVKERWF